MKISLRVIIQEDIPIIKPWLIHKENAKWLDPFFQNDKLSDAQLALFLAKKDRRTYMVMCDGVSVGIMGLTGIDKINRSAEVWFILGDMNYRRKGIISVGHILLLRKAFYELDLHSLHSWVAEGNFSARVFEKLGYKTIGCLKECHMMDGEFKDRILYDILKGDDIDESVLSRAQKETG